MGQATPVFHHYIMSVNDHESATSVDFGVTSKFWLVGAFTSKESTNGEE